METETNKTEIPTNQTQEQTPKRANRSIVARVVFFSTIIFVLAVICYFGYWFLSKSNRPSNPTTSNKQTSSQSAKPKSEQCKDKQEFITKKQGYSVCFPSSWITKQLLPSDIKIGFDTSKVDDSFPGTISITISDKSEDLSVQDVITNALKFEYAKTTVASTRGTKIIFDRSKDDPLSAYRKSIEVVLPKYNRTYTISLSSTEADYQANLAIFDSFLEDFRFLTDEPSLPWSESRNILVYYPWPKDSVTSPIDLNGVAIAFEGVVNIRIKDSKGHILAETTVQTQSGVERSVFKGKVSYDKPSSDQGSIEVFTQSAKDGDEQDKVTIPVNFQD